MTRDGWAQVKEAGAVADEQASFVLMSRAESYRGSSALGDRLQKQADRRLLAPTTRAASRDDALVPGRSR